MEILSSYLTVHNTPVPSGFWGDASTIVSAAATVAIAVFTVWMIIENRSLRKAGFSPHVVAYLVWNPKENGALELAVVNVGTGPAFNVSIELIDHDENDFQIHDVKIANTPYRTPMTVLPQGERQDFFFGISFNLMNCENIKSPLKPFRLKLEYYNIYKHKISNTYTMDINQFDGFSKIIPSNTYAEYLKEISGDLKKHNQNIIKFIDVASNVIQKEKGE